jgi:hypothetical protein
MIVSVQKLNFFLDQHDTLEIKYDLLLDKEQQINDLESKVEGPIKLRKPSEPEPQEYTNIQRGVNKIKIKKILDVQNYEHNIYYLYT